MAFGLNLLLVVPDLSYARVVTLHTVLPATRPSLLPSPFLIPLFPPPRRSIPSLVHCVGVSDPTLPTCSTVRTLQYIPACWCRFVRRPGRHVLPVSNSCCVCLTRVDNPEIAKDPRRRSLHPLATLTPLFLQTPPLHQPYIYITRPPCGNFNRAPHPKAPPCSHSPTTQQPPPLPNGPPKPLPLGSSFGIYKFYQQQPRAFLMQRPC